ncbi:MAG: hypothetical protein PVI18_05575, partial [Desulfobacterales bacterium]
TGYIGAAVTDKHADPDIFITHQYVLKTTAIFFTGTFLRLINTMRCVRPLARYFFQFRSIILSLMLGISSGNISAK